MRMLKIATYIVLHIGILITALVSKGALLLMTNSVSKVQEVRKENLLRLNKIFRTDHKEACPKGVNFIFKNYDLFSRPLKKQVKMNEICVFISSEISI